MKPPTKCGRVHFEHRHRKWLVITVRPTTSVRKSPRKNLPSRNTPDSFCRLLHPTKSIAALRGRYFSFMVTCRGGGPSILLTQDRSVAQKPHWGFHCCATAAFCFPKNTKNPNPSPIEKRFGFSLFGAMEGTRTPGLLIRRNRMAHFVHFIIQRQIVVLIESPLFCRCYSIAFFALLARLCTCYPSLRCAENVQKCAELKSARQNRLFRTAPKAGFQRYLLCKIFQFYPNNNLT